jgi:hypothetical protein
MAAKTKRIVIVGNAKLTEDYSALVDEADMVVRFNDARYYGTGFAGNKTDVLCIANMEHPGRKVAKYKTIKKLAFINQVKAIWFPHFSEFKPAQCWIKPISRARFKQTNYCDWILARNDLTDKNIIHFGSSHYLSACKDLNITETSNLEPSSGYLAIKYIIENYPTDSYEITLFGFTFSGSNSHAWNEEKANIMAWSEKGLVKVL